MESASTVNPRFHKDAFFRANPTEREVLCRALAAEITAAVRSTGDFWGVTRGAVESLRALGHDLWSFDESDDFHLWCPHYGRPTGPGIVLTFRLPDLVEVEWSRE